jgi:hypothetical protein
MSRTGNQSRFKAKLLRPYSPGDNATWAFVILPKTVSDILPRRGRTTVDGRINGQAFQQTLEPDGQLSHWLRVTEDMLSAAHAAIGDTASFEIAPVEQEPEPELPVDLRAALETALEARAAWSETTTIARLDWIHWIESAKQAKTRAKRIANACDMLASGKVRVCCFDPSGFYSKAFAAPKVAD